MITSRNLNLLVGSIASSVCVMAMSPRQTMADQPDRRLTAAAREFERAAENFHAMMQDLPGYSHLTGLSQELAEEAAHLHESAATGSSPNHLRRDFTKARSVFDRLNRDLAEAHAEHDSGNVMRGWRNIENSSARLAKLLGMRLGVDYDDRAISHGNHGGRYYEDFTGNARGHYGRSDLDRRPLEQDRPANDTNAIRFGPIWFGF